MAIDERFWRIVKKHLNYTDDQMLTFKADPRNADVLSKGGELADKLTYTMDYSGLFGYFAALLPQFRKRSLSNAFALPSSQLPQS